MRKNFLSIIAIALATIIASSPTIQFVSATSEDIVVNTQPENVDTSSNTAVNEEIQSYVKITVTDGSAVEPDVRRAVDSLGKIIIKDSVPHLRIKYYSTNIHVVGGDSNTQYEYGIKDLKYSYEKLEDGQEDSATLLNSSEIENYTLKNGNVVLSQADIPIQGHDTIYLYGNSIFNGNSFSKSGYLQWEVISNPSEIDKTKVVAPQLLSVKQLGMNKKTKNEELLPYDFEKNGEILSPYMAKDGKKFKLSESNNALTVYFKRDNVDTTNLRYIRYTLDGSEPNENSPEAQISFQNNAANILANKFYDILIDPLKDIPGFSKEGGDVILKVKGYNLDNSLSSETQEFVFPFDAYSFDDISTTVTLNDIEYDATLDTNRNFALTEGVHLQLDKEIDAEIKTTLLEKAAEKGISNVELVKIRVLDRNNNIYDPYYRHGWNEDKNPLMRLGIQGLPFNKNSAVFVYKNNSWRPVAANKNYKKIVYVDINQPEGFYIFGTYENLLTEQIELLKKNVKEASDKINDLPTSVQKARVQQEIDAANKLLSRNPSFIKADRVVRIIDNLEKVLKELDNATQDLQHLNKKAASLIEISKSDILKKLLTEENYKLITALSTTLENSITEENVNNLQSELDKLDYKYPTKSTEINIRRFDNEDINSMADGVIDHNARLIFAENKTYLEINLKTMVVLTIRAHLLNMTTFEDKLDTSTPFNVYSINKFDDVKSNGELDIFDKKILLELKNPIKQKYEIRVDNDGMPGVNPQAKLFISDISKPIVKKDVAFITTPQIIFNNVENIKFKIDANLESLHNLSLDDQILTLNDYTLLPASSEIILNKSLLNSIGFGMHFLSATFVENSEYKSASITTSFEYKDVNEPTVNNSNDSELITTNIDQNDTNSNSIPNTGVESSNIRYIFIFMLSFIVILSFKKFNKNN